eukprot:7111637-Ditylum_brightwellii.AAC.1
MTITKEVCDNNQHNTAQSTAQTLPHYCIEQCIWRRRERYLGGSHPEHTSVQMGIYVKLEL